MNSYKISHQNTNKTKKKTLTNNIKYKKITIMYIVKHMDIKPFQTLDNKSLMMYN